MRPSLETVPESEWPHGDYRPLATLKLSSDDLVEDLGIKFESYDEAGLGLTYSAALRTLDGTHFLLIDHTNLPGGRRVEISVTSAQLELSILGGILDALGLTQTKVDWISDNARGAA